MKNFRFCKIAAACLAVLCAFAAPVYAAADSKVCYVSIRDPAASDQNDGTEPTCPKANFGTLDGNGAVSAVRGGGTIVASGKLYVPQPAQNMTYTFPDVGGDVLITAEHGGINYMDKKYLGGLEDNDGPDSGVLKIFPAATLRICGNVTFDDIIIYQEYAQSVIRVASGATVTFGDGVKCFKQLGRDYYMALEVEEGAKVILNGGLFSSISGKGQVIDNRSDSDKEISGGNILKPSEDKTVWSENTDYVPYVKGEDKPLAEYTEPIHVFGAEDTRKDITVICCMGAVLAVAVVCACIILTVKRRKNRE